MKRDVLDRIDRVGAPVVVLMVMLGASSALAQTTEEEMVEPPTADGVEDPAPEPVPEPAQASEPADAPAPVPVTTEPVPAGPPMYGPRFRSAVAFTIGAELVPSVDLTFLMYGLDARLGVQINDLVGVYSAIHLSFGKETGGGGITGTFAALLMADITIADMFVIGAGAGYGVFNNPSGPAIGFRAGVYPVHGRAVDSVRRRGLVISVESRVAFLGDPNGTGLMIMGSVGYEAF